MNWEQQRAQREWAERITDTMLEQVAMMQDIVSAALEELDELRGGNVPLKDDTARIIAVYEMVRWWSFEHERVIDRMYADAAEYYA